MFKITLQCIAVWSVTAECEFSKLRVADQEGKAVCVCVLQSGAKRISQTPLPSLDTQSCGNPTAITTPTQA